MFEEFTKKHYEKIQRGLNLTDDQIKEVINQIIKLNPRPGGNVGEINKAESYIVPDFYMERVDNDKKSIVSYDEREIPFDCLISVPVHKGDPVIGRSGLGDEMDFVKADKYTLQQVDFPNVFVIGDAGNFPTSKAGSVVHFQADVLTENLMCAIENRPLTDKFDGHSHCYIDTGFGKGAQIDFNYDTEPLPGSFPFPGIGPFELLKESRTNHYGKLMFRWIYWHILLKGREMPMWCSASIRSPSWRPEA